MLSSTVNLRGLKWLELKISGFPDLEAELDVFLSSCQLGGWVVEAEVPQLRWLAYLPCESDWESRLQSIISGIENLGAECVVGNSVVDEDWAHCWKKFYHAKRFGKHIVVCPSWEDFVAKKDDIVITLDPGMAFGTGYHASTSMCLEMLENVFAEGVPQRVLDVGTGSGILALAAKLLGAEEVVASDSDPVAVKVSQENFQNNNLKEGVKIREYVGVPSDEGKFPLVCANLVASLLCRLARSLSESLDDEGKLIVSGIVQERAEDVIAEFSDCELKLIERLDEDEWVCLLLSK